MQSAVGHQAREYSNLTLPLPRAKELAQEQEQVKVQEQEQVKEQEQVQKQKQGPEQIQVLEHSASQEQANFEPCSLLLQAE